MGSERFGLCATYIDDKLYAATEDYSKLCEETERKVHDKKPEWDNIALSGWEIETHLDVYKINQTNYILNLQSLRSDSNYADSRSLRATLSCLGNSRPDIFCSVAKMAQVHDETCENDTDKYIKNMNDIIDHLSIHNFVSLKYLKFDKDSILKMVLTHDSIWHMRNTQIHVRYN